MDFYFFEEALRITNVWLVGAGLPPLKAAATQVLVNHEARPDAKREVPAPAAAPPVFKGIHFESDCIVNGVRVKAGTFIPAIAPPLDPDSPLYRSLTKRVQDLNAYYGGDWRAETHDEYADIERRNREGERQK